MYDVEKIRADFPILAREVNGKPLTYLDNGASGWDILHLAHRLFPKCRLALMSTRETYRVPQELEAAARPAKLQKPFTDAMMRKLVASKG